MIPAHAISKLYETLRCPTCGSKFSPGIALACTGCGNSIPLLDGLFPDFVAAQSDVSPAAEVEAGNLERQAAEIHRPDWRVDYNIERIELVDRLLPQGLILDVGAADGQISAHLTGPTRTVFAVEKSPSWKTLHGSLSVPFAFCDIYQFPFARDSFDGLLFGEILEHIYDPTEALRRAIPLLKTGGVVVGTVPNFYFYKKRLLYLRGEFGEDPGRPLTHEHIRLFSCHVLHRLLSDLALDDIKIFGVWQRNVFPLLGMSGAFKPLQTRLAAWYPSMFAVTLVFSAKRRPDAGTPSNQPAAAR